LKNIERNYEWFNLIQAQFKVSSKFKKSCKTLLRERETRNQLNERRTKIITESELEER
jgi:hypothetical protein